MQLNLSTKYVPPVFLFLKTSKALKTKSWLRRYIVNRIWTFGDSLNKISAFRTNTNYAFAVRSVASAVEVTMSTTSSPPR